MNKKKLINMAIKARKNAYVPYSRFHVGAALITKSGKIYTGCNIESASYTPTNCAERTAIFKAVSEGHKDIETIVIIGDSEFTYPCGVCRQVMREFNKNMHVIIAKDENNFKEYTLEELLPNSFGPEDLKNKEERCNEL